jgi:hypothetical protein
MRELIERDYKQLQIDQDLGLGMTLWLAHFFPQERWAKVQTERSLSLCSTECGSIRRAIFAEHHICGTSNPLSPIMASRLGYRQSGRIVLESIDSTNSSMPIGRVMSMTARRLPTSWRAPLIFLAFSCGDKMWFVETRPGHDHR